MTGLDDWLRQATRSLSRESAAQVRIEIQDHYESARDATAQAGASAEEADRRALAALGDAKTANCQYRHVLLTAAEARILRSGNWEAGLVCARPWLKWLMAGATIAATIAAIVLFVTAGDLARVALAGILLLGPLFVALALPIYTPARARIFRRVKWAALIGGFGLAFGPDLLKMSWLLFSCLWAVAWVEWTRVSIRRKLPVARWPKQLYI
jgi:hypothetical protein